MDVSNYSRAQYYISDDGTATNELYIFNGYYLNGESFTSNDQIQVGDDVVLYGQLMLFGSTLEMDANNYIYQHNGEGGGGIEVTKYETLAAAKAAAKGTATEAILDLNNVVVTYVDGTNYYIYDGSDGFLIYGSISGLTDIAVGDVLTGQIKGDLYLYYGLPELVPATSGTEVTKTGTATFEPESAEMGDVLNNGFAFSSKLVKLSDVVFGASELTTQGANKHGQVTIMSMDKEALLFDQFNILEGITFDTSMTYEIDCIVTVRDGAVQFYPIERNQFISKVHVFGDEYDGEYWATYYHSESTKVADDNTTVYVGRLSADNSVLLLYEVIDKTINSGEAVILKSTKADIVLSSTDNSGSYDFSGNSLSGVDDKTEVPTDHGTIYTLIIEDGELAFKKFTGNELGAHKAYLPINATSDAPIPLMLEGDATGINSIHNSAFTIDHQGYYTIDGRRHFGTPTTRGLYIINGKKCYIESGIRN